MKNNEKETKKNRRAARIHMVACGLLFSVFSIVYLAVFQCDVMEALHYSLAQGKTQYAPWASAVLLTVVLLIFRWLLNGLLRLRGPFYALSYFPCCLLLGVLTDVGYGVYQGEGVEVSWTWLLPLLLFGFSRLLHQVGQRADEGVTLNINLLTLLLLCLMTVGIGNSDIHFHHELEVESALRKNDYEEALRVGEKTMDPSRNLTALRAYAMSRQGSLGDSLFRYPQLYGASGLLIEPSGEKSLRLNADSLYVYLGARPSVGEPALAFFDRICHEETGNYTTLDYYLSALLLEKQLDRFATEFEALYTVQEEIPSCYKEALYLYGKTHPDAPLKIEDGALEERWQAYRQLKEELAGEVGEGNHMRRKYGDTYWWYYEYR